MERPLTEALRPDGRPLTLAEYERGGGYAALRKAVTAMSPADVTSVVKDANLRGRGGAGFPTGVKWTFVPQGEDAPRPKYLLANADEMEPGTFKDRLLLEGNPHQLLEGMALASYAMQADVAYLFLRWAYKRAAAIMQTAIGEAYEAGYLGKNILGSRYDLELRLHMSAGRYICGEETGLISSLEGRRASPRSKPPFPPVVGAWGQPSIVQNVETLSCVPHIVNKGADWWQGLAFGDGDGTKIYGASGKVRKPGLWELPMGTTMREILEEHAGGMQAGRSFRGALPGGASTDFLIAEHLDVRMDFKSVAAAGSRLGTGTMIVLDDATCPVGAILNLIQFFAQESCGWCTPCRNGLAWARKTLQALEEGSGRPEDLQILEQTCKLLGPGYTFCALAPGAVEPLQSGLKYYREDFEQHIRAGGCPWR